MPDPVPEPSVPVLSALLSVEISYLPDGGGSLVLRHVRPEEEHYRHVSFLPHGTEPRLWLDLVADFLSANLHANIDPF